MNESLPGVPDLLRRRNLAMVPIPISTLPQSPDAALQHGSAGITWAVTGCQGQNCQGHCQGHCHGQDCTCCAAGSRRAARASAAAATSSRAVAATDISTVSVVCIRCSALCSGLVRTKTAVSAADPAELHNTLLPGVNAAVPYPPNHKCWWTQRHAQSQRLPVGMRTKQWDKRQRLCAIHHLFEVCSRASTTSCADNCGGTLRRMA